MSEEVIASRELRNDTAGVLRRVEAGEQVTITVNGRPVATMVPVQRSRRSWIRREELVSRLRRRQADPGLRTDLARLAGETTDDLGPIR
jgi:prevent-host-death family protein